MIERRYKSTESLDGVIDLERLRSGPTDSLESGGFQGREAHEDCSALCWMQPSKALI